MAADRSSVVGRAVSLALVAVHEEGFGVAKARLGVAVEAEEQVTAPERLVVDVIRRLKNARCVRTRLLWWPVTSFTARPSVQVMALISALSREQIFCRLLKCLTPFSKR